jgi:hypothetical protein
MNKQIHDAIEKAIKFYESYLDRNATAQELSDLRKKYGVPESGTQYNTDVDRIYKRLESTGFKDESWEPAGGQADRLKALKNSSSWKDGYFMCKDGKVMYPYIDKNGTPQVSGVRAAAQRASQQGETKVADTASAVLERVNKAKDK